MSKATFCCFKFYGWMVKYAGFDQILVKKMNLSQNNCWLCNNTLFFYYVYSNGSSNKLQKSDDNYASKTDVFAWPWGSYDLNGHHSQFIYIQTITWLACVFIQIMQYIQHWSSHMHLRPSSS